MITYSIFLLVLMNVLMGIFGTKTNYWYDVGTVVGIIIGIIGFGTFTLSLIVTGIVLIICSLIYSYA